MLLSAIYTLPPIHPPIPNISLLQNTDMPHTGFRRRVLGTFAAIPISTVIANIIAVINAYSAVTNTIINNMSAFWAARLIVNPLCGVTFEAG